LRDVAPGRLTSKPLLDYLLGVAADWCATHGLPLHLHTGFGDRDVDLRLANPLHLRPLLESGRLGGSPLVLLHASYPYTREAAYLASVYPNLYVDLSLVSPLLAGPALTHVFQDLLGLAPVTRLLYGSDAWGIPDWLWLAARATRRALGDALSWLPPAEAEWAARRILHDNAAELYRVS
jgi:predicted TIM-barrel fold metal-dependent hydrolase